MDILSLLKTTGAYKAVKNDKENKTLSHAYLVLCADGEYLTEYLKCFVKLLACEEKDPCGECRACRLISDNAYPDSTFYPADGKAVSVADVNDLIEKSYLKPVEGDKKIFAIAAGDTMTAAAQNKLLKTLEEPPVGTYIIIAAKSEYPILSTVKSRVKKLVIPAFSDETLYDALLKDFPDEERLKNAVSCGDGTVGSIKDLYSDDGLVLAERFAEDMINGMQSSRDVLDYSLKIDELIAETVKDYRIKRADELPKEARKTAESAKRYLTPIITERIYSVIESYLRDMLCYFQGEEELVFNKTRLDAVKNAKGYNAASVVYALDKINEARKRKYFNGGGNMLNEWLLFSILEGKHKWQK